MELFSLLFLLFPISISNLFVVYWPPYSNKRNCFYRPLGPYRDHCSNSTIDQNKKRKTTQPHPDPPLSSITAAKQNKPLARTTAKRWPELNKSVKSTVNWPNQVVLDLSPISVSPYFSPLFSFPSSLSFHHILSLSLSRSPFTLLHFTLYNRKLTSSRKPQ